MQLSWKDYLALHWPYLAMGLIAIVSAIYTVGYESGKRSILWAAERSQNEVKFNGEGEFAR